MIPFNADHGFPPLSPDQLSKYLVRIHLSEGTSIKNISEPALPPKLPPTLETLNRVLFHHGFTIPFENGPMLFFSTPGPMSVDAIVDQLVTCRRGGFCHQNTILFIAACKALGFTVTAGMARMITMNQEKQEWDIGATTHMVAFVHINEKKYLVEIGKLRASEALEIKDGARCAGPAGEVFQLRSADFQAGPEGGFVLWHKRSPYSPPVPGMDAEGFYPYQHFTTAANRPKDYEPFAWFVQSSENPKHVLRRVFIASLLTRTNGRLFLTNRSFRHLEGKETRESERSFEIESADDWVRALKQEFGCELGEKEAIAAREHFFF
ncbi:hypothetical protein HDU98_008825 [Podochytrium sp. JEL0797]|nr:hypothetical protein HDU98_008825 [Podochytrium sp. JEL0797]